MTNFGDFRLVDMVLSNELIKKHVRRQKNISEMKSNRGKITQNNTHKKTKNSTEQCGFANVTETSMK